MSKPIVNLKPGPKVRHGVRERLLTFFTAIVVLSCGIGAVSLMGDGRWLDAQFNVLLAALAILARWMDRNRNWVSLSNDWQTLTIRTWTGCRQLDLDAIPWRLVVPHGRDSFLRPVTIRVPNGKLRLTPIHQRWDTWGPSGDAAERLLARLKRLEQSHF